MDASTRIAHLIANEFDIPLEEVDQTLAYGETPEWDSLGHMHLVAALEDAFEITFADEDIVKLTSLEKITAHVSAALSI